MYRITATPVVDGELAVACLKSVPLGKEEALQLLESILPYIKWQSGRSILFSQSARGS
jgi:hypothetical protein